MMGKGERGLAMEMQRGQDGQAAARRSRHSAAPGGITGKARSAGGRLLALLRRGDEGQALVETALVMAFLLLPLLMGIFVLSFAVYDQMLLQTAANQGVQTLALDQNISPLNPCTDATNTINAATNLNSSLITITFWNGSAGTGTAISGSSCAGLLSGTQVSVKTTYPCSLTFFSFMHSCQLTASQSEQVP
jgi:Flp pilus assembly protein TadG